MTYQQTSRMAYESIIPKLPEMKRRIFEYLLEDSSTCDELEQGLGMSHQTASATMTALKRDKLIKPKKTKEGKRIRRRTRSGRLADVYRVVRL